MAAVSPPPRPPGISIPLWFWSVFVSLEFVALFLFVRIPVNIFEASPGEHSSTMGDLLGWLATWGAGACIIAGVLLFLLLMPVRFFASSLLLALALGYWMADSFFIRGYPQLDGTTLQIEPGMLRGWLEIVVLAVLTAAILKAKGRAHVPVLLFLALLAVANATWVLRHVSVGEGGFDVLAHRDDAEKIFSLSDSGNVVIMVLDTFQSDYLPDAFAADPSLAAAFDGFVYYPDTLGEAPSTYLSLPAIHSGQSYDPARTMAGHFDRSIRGSFMGELGRAGYLATLLNPIRLLCPEDVTCVTRDDLLRSRRETSFREALHLLDISLMRSAPEFLKDMAFNGGEFHLLPWYSPVNLGGEAQMVYDDARLLEMFASQLEVISDRRRASFLHLMTTHPPYALDEQCLAKAELPAGMDRKAAIPQVRCALGRIAGLLSAMKQAGVFDNSMLVILGDHGSSSEAAAEDMSSSYLKPGQFVPANAARLVGSANPLLMIKPVGSNGPLRTDGREADLIDLRSTICAELVACTWGAGQDLLAPDAPSRRHRRFMSYRWEHQFWDLGYVPEVDFYGVMGPLDEWDSWNAGEGGIRRTPAGGLSFSDDDDPDTFGEGWGAVEVDASGVLSKRWATARQALLFLDLDESVETGSSYQLNFEVYTPDFIENQAISLLFNGELIAKRKAGKGMQTISYRVPLSLVRQGRDTVTLEFDTVHEGTASDERSLAASFFSLAVEHISAPRH